MPLAVPKRKKMAKGAGAGRKQVALKPGHSLMSWIKMTEREGHALAGLKGGRPGPITTSQLAEHSTLDDCWMALAGKVYNVTPYMDFHPGGGDELLRAAGADGTQLFNDIHPWVGFLVPDDFDNGSSARPSPQSSSSSPSSSSSLPHKGAAAATTRTAAAAAAAPASAAFKEPRLPAAKAKATTKANLKAATPPIITMTDADADASPPQVQKHEKTKPTRDWYQTEKEVVITIYKLFGGNGTLDSANIELDGQAFQLGLETDTGYYYRLMLTLPHASTLTRIKLNKTKTNVDLHFTKTAASIKWPSCGVVLHESFKKLKQRSSVSAAAAVGGGNGGTRDGAGLLATAAAAAAATASTLSVRDGAEIAAAFSARQGDAEFALAAVHSLNHDTRLYRFVPKAGAADIGASVCDLDLGQHVRITVDVPVGSGSGSSSGSAPPGSTSLWENEQKSRSRSYTPVALPLPLPAGTLLKGDGLLAPNSTATPSLDLLVKIYPTGVVSSRIDQLNVHETVAVSCAAGGLPWSPEDFDDVCMVYGGTGITPMLGVMKHLRELKGCETNMHVIACNRGVNDILLQDQLDELAFTGEGRFTATHVLSEPPTAGSAEVAGEESIVRGQRISLAILKARLPPAGNRVLVLVCGRPSFASRVASMLKNIGHTYHVFG